MSEEILKVSNVTIGYKSDAPIVSDVSFEIARGQIVSIIGPNGAGKSTLLKTVSGIINPIGGSITVDSRNIQDMKPIEMAQKIAVVSTKHPNTEWMTCEEVVEAGRYPYTGMMGKLSPEDHDIVNEAMEDMNIIKLRDAYFNQISDGQRQRVLLAGAVCQQPELLIMDEPTSFLDIKYKLQMMEWLGRLTSKRNIAVLTSLHEIAIVKRVSDKVLCIRDGKIWMFDDTDKVLTESNIEKLYDLDEGAYHGF